MGAILINVRVILHGGDFAVGRFDLHSTAILIGELQSRKFLWKFNLNEIIIVGAIWTCEGSRKNVDLHLTYKIQDIVFPIHGPHKGIKSINI